MSPWANNLLRRRAPPVADAARRKKLPRSKISRTSADAPDDIFGDRKGRSLVRIRPPQPTMRTDLDIGAENPVITMVTGFFLAFF